MPSPMIASAVSGTTGIHTRTLVRSAGLRSGTTGIHIRARSGSRTRRWCRARCRRRRTWCRTRCRRRRHRTRCRRRRHRTRRTMTMHRTRRRRRGCAAVVVRNPARRRRRSSGTAPAPGTVEPVPAGIIDHICAIVIAVFVRRRHGRIDHGCGLFIHDSRCRRLLVNHSGGRFEHGAHQIHNVRCQPDTFSMIVGRFRLCGERHGGCGNDDSRGDDLMFHISVSFILRMRAFVLSVSCFVSSHITQERHFYFILFTK